MQSVSVDIATASDHTFAVAKNYRDLPSDAWCLTENASLGEFSGGWFVMSTAITKGSNLQNDQTFVLRSM